MGRIQESVYKATLVFYARAKTEDGLMAGGRERVEKNMRCFFLPAPIVGQEPYARR